MVTDVKWPIIAQIKRLILDLLIQSKFLNKFISNFHKYTFLKHNE